MKTLVLTLTFLIISIDLAQAEIAIDGKDYETTIPVTMDNFDHVEAAVNFKSISKINAIFT